MIQLPDHLDISNFCIQPWIHLASWNDGSVPLCCVAAPEVGINLNDQLPVEIWNSEQFRKARRQFLAGLQPKQCSSCWKEESTGMKSHRMIENNMWANKLGKDKLNNLINQTLPDGTLPYSPLTLDLRLGNTCNLQCVMCRPRDSSKWLNDSKKLSDTLVSPVAKADWAHKSTSISTTDMFDWFERESTQESLNSFLGDIRHIIFGGGEPLLIKEHEAFITSLVESGNSKNIELRYHTNGTILNEHFIDLWNQFKEVELMISIDDWGDRNNYVRYPAQWSTILKNLDRLDATPDNIIVNILTTVHAMNVYNLPDFAMQLLQRGWKKICRRTDGLFVIGTVHWPKYMSTKTLTPLMKAEVINHWDSFSELATNVRWQTRIKPQIEFMLSGDDSFMMPDLLDYIQKLDSMRPLKFSELYEDYYKILRK